MSGSLLRTPRRTERSGPNNLWIRAEEDRQGGMDHAHDCGFAKSNVPRIVRLQTNYEIGAGGGHAAARPHTAAADADARHWGWRLRGRTLRSSFASRRIPQSCWSWLRCPWLLSRSPSRHAIPGRRGRRLSTYSRSHCPAQAPLSGWGCYTGSPGGCSPPLVIMPACLGMSEMIFQVGGTSGGACSVTCSTASTAEIAAPSGRTPGWASLSFGRRRQRTGVAAVDLVGGHCGR